MGLSAASSSSTGSPSSPSSLVSPFWLRHSSSSGAPLPPSPASAHALSATQLVRRLACTLSRRSFGIARKTASSILVILLDPSHSSTSALRFSSPAIVRSRFEPSSRIRSLSREATPSMVRILLRARKSSSRHAGASARGAMERISLYETSRCRSCAMAASGGTSLSMLSRSTSAVSVAHAVHAVRRAAPSSKFLRSCRLASRRPAPAHSSSTTAASPSSSRLPVSSSSSTSAPSCSPRNDASCR
mmetsp:Transcript_11782/g.36422  ORF Transcript_11782/g.36422 Transcript_11782/m.36422 type:complete len:245 (+) Transcript_11782:296-1030(+)